MKSLTLIQKELNVPKLRENKFSGFYFRSCEDIVEALKPLLKKYECELYITDSIEMVGDRFYVKATATFKDSEGNTTSVSGYAREPLSKKGCDDSQVTGGASSYARKYALNGLFLIDDSSDVDTLEVVDGSKLPEVVKKDLSKCKTAEDVTKVYNKHLPKLKDPTKLIEACKIKKSELVNQ